MNSMEDLIQEWEEDTCECLSMMIDLFEKSERLFRAKNVAYGNSAIRGIQKYGKQSAIWRLSDKFNRIEALLMGSENLVFDESIEDTLLDLSTYCLITIYALRKLEEDGEKENG